MYQQYLQKIEAQARMYGERIHPPASEADLASLSARSLAELSAEVPQQYKDFLRVRNGLNFDGLFIYSSHNTDDYKHGFVDSNLDWRSYEINNDLLYFADADINLYVYNLVEGRYEIQDRPSGDVYDTFKTFDEMITEALRLSLHEDKEEDEE